MPKRKKLLTIMLQQLNIRDFSFAHTKTSLGYPKFDPKQQPTPRKIKENNKNCFESTELKEKHITITKDIKT